MKTLLTGEQSGSLDAATRGTLALEPVQLMEKASLRIWDAFRLHISADPGLSKKDRNLRIVALCGKGDNGGDALAILRHAFSAGFTNLAAVVSGRESSPSALKQAKSLEAAGFHLVAWDGNDEEGMLDMLSGADIVLDGVLGTGLKGAATGEAKAMIDCLGRAGLKAGAPIVASIDLPSGAGEGWMPGFPCVKADLSFCLEPVKAACYLPEIRPLCGTLVPVADVFPEILAERHRELRLLEGSDLALLQAPVDKTGYKMSRGRLAIFAGSKGAIGAAQLCARAALASGAGYVTLYVDEELYPLLAPVLESVIVKTLLGKPALGAFDAILAGPGWGQGPGRLELLAHLIDSPLPLILDADAIRLIAEKPELLSGRKAACAATPHPGEFSALVDAMAGAPARAPASAPSADESSALSPWEAMGRVSEAYNLLAVIKSHVTWVVSPGGRRWVWEGMTPELGTAGSGDVLAGLFAGIAAGRSAEMKRKAGKDRQDAGNMKTALEEAACMAVIAHGLAGRALADSKGWFQASDLVEECSSLLHRRKENA